MLEKLPDVVGHALHGQRAGLEKIVFNKAGLRGGMASIQLSSLAFIDHGPIPVPYTADGPGTSPPLQWSGIPPSATSLVLIVEDADAPLPQPLVHAIVVNLPGGDGALPEGAIQSDGGELGLTVGRHSLLQSGWLPPDPPPGHGQHRYAFQLFALASEKPFSANPGRDELLTAVQERAIASGLLIGTYERPDGSEKVDSPMATSSVAVGTGPLST